MSEMRVESNAISVISSFVLGSWRGSLHIVQHDVKFFFNN